MTAIKRSRAAAAAAAFLLCQGAHGMMCNVKGAYRAETTIGIPAFSRVRADMLFKQGDVIEIFAFPKNRPLSVSWSLARNMVATPFAEGAGEVCLDHTVRVVVPADRLIPGFHDLHLSIDTGGEKPETGRTTFGYCIDSMPAPASCPPDLGSFWKEALRELDGIELDAGETFVREMSAEEVTAYNTEHASMPGNYAPDTRRDGAVRVYKVQFNSAGSDGPRRYYGWLTLPAGEGPFPGLLVLPGAGCAALPAPAEHACQGFVSLMLHIHGMDVDQEEYKSPAGYMRGPLGPEIRDDYYYYVFLACAQAVRYLAGRPDVDASRIGVAGGSQGGLLSIATAALCPDVKAAAASICFYGNWPFRDRVTRLNRNKASGLDEPAAPFDRDDPRQNHMSYYDAMNLATLVRAPVLMGASMCDNPSPPASVWAVYRSLASSDKQLHWSAGTNHGKWIPFEREGFRWMQEKLGTPLPSDL